MKQLPSGRKVLQPTSIDKVTREEQYGGNQKQVYGFWGTNGYVPTAWQRVHGYHANPLTCTHHRRRFRGEFWVCMDCGKRVT